MAQLRKSRSYVILLLELLTKLQGGISSTDLYKMAFGGHDQLPLTRKPEPDAFEATLNHLAELGLIVASDGRWFRSDSRAKPTQETDESARGGGGGGGGRDRDPPSPGNGGDGQGRGGGVVEVLEHPVMFCYTREAFEAAVDNCLVVYGG